MTNLLARLFIKDYKNTDNYKVREQYGKLAGIAGITTNLLLFVMKITVGAILTALQLLQTLSITYQTPLLPLSLWLVLNFRESRLMKNILTATQELNILRV